MIRAVIVRPAEFNGQVGRAEVNAPQRGCHTNWSRGATGRPTRRRIGVERPRELTIRTDQLGSSDEIRGSPSGNTPEFPPIVVGVIGAADRQAVQLYAASQLSVHTS